MEERQIALCHLIVEHEVQVHKNDPEQHWLVQRQWSDIRSQAIDIGVIREMIEALRLDGR